MKHREPRHYPDPREEHDTLLSAFMAMEETDRLKSLRQWKLWNDREAELSGLWKRIEEEGPTAISQSDLGRLALTEMRRSGSRPMVRMRAMGMLERLANGGDTANLGSERRRRFDAENRVSSLSGEVERLNQQLRAKVLEIAELNGRESARRAVQNGEKCDLLASASFGAGSHHVDHGRKNTKYPKQVRRTSDSPPD